MVTRESSPKHGNSSPAADLGDVLQPVPNPAEPEPSRGVVRADPDDALPAAIGDEEIVFTDGAVSRRQSALVRQDFRPRERASLDVPVAHRVVHYAGSSLTLMQRLQGEFHRALEQLRDHFNAPFPGRVIPLRR